MTVEPLDVFECPLDGIGLIEASAGTGKTWNICGLYLRLVLERQLEVQQILVVTFTNAATAELRERIRDRMVQVLGVLRQRGPAPDVFTRKLLSSLHRRRHLDDEMARRLDAAVQNFDEAAIFTIHGFCKRALDDAPFAAGMPLAQELLADDRELVDAVAGDFWRRHVAAPRTSPALAAYLLAQKDSPGRFAKLLRRQAGKPLSRVIWPAGSEGDPNDLDFAALQAAHEAARALWLAGRDAIVQRVRTAQQEKRLNGTSYKPERIEAAAVLWDQLLAPASATAASLALSTHEQARAELLTAVGLAAKLNRGRVPCEPHPFFDAAGVLLEERARAGRILQLARMRLLRRLVEEGPIALREAKRERRLVAFDDMLFNLHQRLSSGACPWLPATLRQRFPAALIDEFQDTDPLQFSIFRSIYGGGQSPLFLVGDPKQAIYSFRNADLHTYLRAREMAQAQYTLAQNQRSTKELLQGLNAVFEANPRAFMLPRLAYHRVEAGDKKRAVLRDASAARAPLQLWVLPGQDGGNRPVKPDARRMATTACAGEIARLLSAAQTGGITLDERPLAAGDIAVLVRNHAQGSEMRQALRALGVGCVELSQASVFESSDAMELERVLAAIVEPSREGLLRAALSTELMGLDAAGLEALANDEQAFLERMTAFADYRDDWLSHGAGRMLRELFVREQVNQRMLARTDGERRLTNLRHLAECLHEASREHGTPEALLGWLRRCREERASDEATQVRLESDRNLVQIVTIHRSKGLEYPIVFCPFLWDGHPGGSRNAIPGVEYHDDKGEPVVDFSDAADPAIKLRVDMERAAEHLRLIYVALTRAVHRCYVVVGSYWASRSMNECTRGPINWLVAGREHAPQAWLANSLGAADIDNAWERLARANGPVIALAPLPQDQATPLVAPATPPDQLAALAPPAFIPPAWWIGSYSSLAHGARTEFAADHDTRVQDLPSLPLATEGAMLPLPLATEGAMLPLPLAGEGWGEGSLPPPPLGEGQGGGSLPASTRETGALATLPPDDILRFPRGARAGETLHAIFEHTDFTDASQWPEIIAQVLRFKPPQAFGESASWPAMVQCLLTDVTSTPLAAGHRLDEITPARRLVELEFSLPASGLDARALAATLRRHGYDAGALAFGRLEGYLRGFIDLVYKHQGRFHVLDWKSNHLGWSAADYAAAKIADAMAQQGYQLQYLLYTVALHRYLRQRLQGYDYEKHFGGVSYLFVRGVRPAWTNADGSAAGVYFHRPSLAVIEELDALLGMREGALA